MTHSTFHISIDSLKDCLLHNHLLVLQNTVPRCRLIIGPIGVVNIEYQYRHRYYRRYFCSIDIGIDNTLMSRYRKQYRRYFYGHIFLDTSMSILLKRLKCSHFTRPTYSLQQYQSIDRPIDQLTVST